jgi:hypothetical protein
VVEFCERMEAAEDFHPVQKKATGSSTKKTKYNGSKGKNSKGNGDKWCEYHESDTHNTSECTVLKKLKDSKKPASDQKPAAKKDWKSKSNDAKKFTKKELNAIVKKKVQKAKKELNMANKRKSDSDDDQSATSLHMLENEMQDVDEQLKKFDFDETKLGKSADC